MNGNTENHERGVFAELRPSVVIATHPNVEYVVQGVTTLLRQRGIEVHIIQPDIAVDRIPDCHVVMPCSAFRCGESVMDALPHLRGIAALAAGTESIDIPAATRRRLPVAHAPTPENVTSMAEATVMLILAALYRLPESQERFRSGWDRPRAPYARMLSGKTLGLVGFGKIARAVAERLSSWNVRLITYSPRAPQASLPACVQKVDLESLLAQSDVISLHAAVTDDNRYIINARTLKLAKPGIVLVNTARGALVDQIELLEHLQHDGSAYVALDCFDPEPLPMDSPVRRLGKGILTPHIVGHTRETQESLIEQGVDNVMRILNYEAPEFVRNPEVLEGWVRASDRTRLAG